jgi:nucleotide-binding universal stress UspA family protein
MGEIAEYCEKAKPYMVIMGAETADVLERILFGGKTLEAIRNLRWPTLTVPPQAAFNNIRTIGVACDFKNVVETVRVKEIKELVNEFGAELHVLYVNDRTRGPYDPETVEESALLQKKLGDLRPKYHFLKEENIDAAIAEYAEKNKLDVLIIIPKKHTLAEQIFRHSHSKGILLHSQVPVMSLHE